MSLDILSAVKQANKGRDVERMRLKYARMAESPFVFFRGTCHLFYQHWTAQSEPFNAPAAWISGDLHFENFGAYKGDNRLVYFDINDFDEAALAPASWELARFMASLFVGAGTIGIEHEQALLLGQQFLDSYRAVLRTGKARWLERSTADGMVRELLRVLKKRQRSDLLAKRCVVKGSVRRLRCDNLKALPVSDADREKVLKFLARFAKSQAHPEFFEVLDVARRIAGTGSLGLERYVILVRGRGTDENFLLDLKHQPTPVVATSSPLPQPGWANSAERVMTIQERCQAISPAFLNAVRIGSRSYILRELLPQEDRLDLSSWGGRIARLERVVAAMGLVVASAQLRGAGRQGSALVDELVDFAKRDDWQATLMDAAHAAAWRNVLDWERYRDAFQAGHFDL